MKSARRARRKADDLRLATAGVIFVWLVVLPKLSETDALQKRIRFLESRGIDPAALFYSDHPGRQQWERRAMAVRESLNSDNQESE